MKLKQIIGLIIAIVAFVSAGIFAYMTIVADKTPQVTTPVSTAEILPKGNKLDFEDVNKFNKNGKLFRYPVVSKDEIEVVNLNDLMEKKIQPSE